MPEVVEIVEVNGRADGGISARPFRCRGSDERQYYVKLGNARPDGLVAEWICGHLGKAMELPVADFSLVSVDHNFKQGLPAEYSELGQGIGFGSVAAPVGVREVMSTDLNERGDPDVLADLLAFDAWIQNEDRKLGPAGGNPNTLFVPNTDSPFVLIDHDSAFDTTFDSRRFSSDHLGRGQSSLWLDAKRRARWLERAKTASDNLDAIWANIPREWLVNEYGDARAILTKDAIRSILDRPLLDPDAFWKIVTRR